MRPGVDVLLKAAALGKHLTALLLGLSGLFLSFSALALEPVRLQLKWTHAFQFAGYYAALEQGYYREAGLDVTLIEGQPGISVIDEVLSGNADFGIGTSSLLLTQPTADIALLANIFQHSPQVLVAVNHSPFQGVHDLAGKTLMLEDGADELIAYLISEGVTPNTFQQVPHDFSIDSLIEGRVDAMSAYLTHELYYLDKAGLSIQIYTPRSVGIDFYGDNLFTRRELASQHPERVEAFTQASLRGWDYALNHIDETIELIRQHYTTAHSADFLRFEAEGMVQLIRPDLVELGYINPGRWQHIAEIYQDLGLLDAIPDWNQFFFQPEKEQLKDWLTLLIISSILVALLSVIALYIYRVNRRLRQLLTEQRRDHHLKQDHNHILAMIAADQPLDATLEAIALSIETYRPGYLCSILLCDTEQNCLVQGAAPSLPESYNSRIRQVPIKVGAGSCGTAAATRQRVIVSDIQSHPYWKTVRELAASAGLAACWSQPVLDKSGQVLATFALYHRQPCEPSEEDIRLIEEVAQLAAIAIERNEVMQLLRTSEQHHRYLAQHDPLTGLANRHLFSDRVEQAIRLAERDQSHLALLLIDLNDFKLINDAHGHAIGDALLQAIATRLRENVRNSETVCRFGGDEFIILLQGIQQTAEAFSIREKLLQAMDEPFQVETLQIQSGCSIGVACYPEDGQDESSLTQMADQRMYDEKRRSK